MKGRTKEHICSLLSAYADNKLTEREKSEVEELLRSDDEARSEYDLLCRQKNLLGRKTPLPPNEWFWQQLEPKLSVRSKQSEMLLPFSRKYLPLTMSLASFIIVLSGIFIIRQKDAVEKYFSEKKEQVKHIYDGGLFKGTILPLFTSLNKDQVLQFALFGSLPLDANAQTALKVDETSEKGYQLEIAKKGARTQKHVTVNEFYRAVGASPEQHIIVDSILHSGMEKIQASILVTDNNTLAVHEELVKLNRVMVSSIAASLEDVQRLRFQQYLEKVHAPYTFKSRQREIMPSKKIYAKMAEVSKPGRFFMITPDTISLTELQYNLDSIRLEMERIAPAFSSGERRAHVVIQQFSNRRTPLPDKSAQFDVFTDEGNIRIHIAREAERMLEDNFFIDVVPRPLSETPSTVIVRGREPENRESLIRDQLRYGQELEASKKGTANLRKRDANTPLTKEELLRNNKNEGMSLDSLVKNYDRNAAPNSRTKKFRTQPFEL